MTFAVAATAETDAAAGHEYDYSAYYAQQAAAGTEGTAADGQTYDYSAYYAGYDQQG